MNFALEKRSVAGEMHPLLRISLLWLLAALGSLPLSAQGTGFSLGQTRVSAGWDSKFLHGGEELKDSVFLIEPARLSWKRLTARSELSFGYQPEFELFGAHRELNAWNHRAMFRFDYRLSRRSALRAGATATLTQDPARSLGGSLFVLPRSSYRASAAYLSFTHRLNAETALDVRLDHTITKIGLPDVVTPGLFDQMGGAATVMLSRSLGTRQAVSASYSFLKPTLLGRDLEGAGTLEGLFRAMHNVHLGYHYMAAGGISCHLSAGVIRSLRPSYVLAGHVEKQGRIFDLGVGYSRHVSFFGPEPSADGALSAVDPSRGLLSTTLFHTGMARLRGKIGSRASLELKTQASKSSSQSLERKIEALWGALRLEYELTERLSTFFDFELFGQKFNEFLGAPVSRKRYFGGLRIRLERSPRIPAQVPEPDSSR